MKQIKRYQAFRDGDKEHRGDAEAFPGGASSGNLPPGVNAPSYLLCVVSISADHIFGRASTKSRPFEWETREKLIDNGLGPVLVWIHPSLWGGRNSRRLEGGAGEEGCGVRVRGDLGASLCVYHTAARPLPGRRGRPRGRRRSGVVSGTVRPYLSSAATFVCLGGAARGYVPTYIARLHRRPLKHWAQTIQLS